MPVCLRRFMVCPAVLASKADSRRLIYLLYSARARENERKTFSISIIIFECEIIFGTCFRFIYLCAYVSLIHMVSACIGLFILLSSEHYFSPTDKHVRHHQGSSAHLLYLFPCAVVPRCARIKPTGARICQACGACVRPLHYSAGLDVPV